MREARAGRPPVVGPRYESGRSKPERRSSGVATQRAREAVRRGILDPRAGSEIELLGPAFAGELSHRQTDTANMVGRIYQAFERFERLRRDPASPSYMRAHGSDDDPIDPIELQKLERRVRRARKRWQDVQDEIAAMPPGVWKTAREALETLCVANQPIAAALLPSMRYLLDRIAARFGGQQHQGGGPHPMAVTRHRPARRPQASDRAHRERAIDKDAWTKCTAELRPDLDADGLEREWQRLQAVKDNVRAREDRDRVRRDKERRR